MSGLLYLDKRSLKTTFSIDIEFCYKIQKIIYVQYDQQQSNYKETIHYYIISMLSNYELRFVLFVEEPLKHNNT